MTTQKDLLEAAIRHIQTSADIDHWAMELAISALKAQDATDTNVGSNDGTISRQMAIDAILHLTNQDSVRGQYEFVKKHGLEKMWSGGIVDAIDAVIAVPPAQPEHPEIIRCKDCKHWKQQTNYAGVPLSFGFCESDDMWRSLYGETTEVSHIDTNDDFYCGYAERRTDETD